MIKKSIVVSLITLLMVGCSDTKESSDAKSEKSMTTQSAPSSIYGTNASAGANVQSGEPHVGKVLETIDAAGYTYVKVHEKGNSYWVAAPKTTVKVGDTVSYIEQMVMKDFTSKSLNKKFEYLMFANAIVPPGGCNDCDNHANKPADHNCEDHKAVPQKIESVPSSNTASNSNVAQAEVKKVNVAKLKGGYTVEEIYASKAKLKDKKIKLKAQVVKVSKGIMGKDWVHLQDGTGKGQTSDIIATTKSATVNLGDVVVVDATLKTDVDLGYGYFFSIILEESKFSN